MMEGSTPGNFYMYVVSCVARRWVVLGKCRVHSIRCLPLSSLGDRRLYREVVG
jgi:hypothetical protein